MQRQELFFDFPHHGCVDRAGADAIDMDAVCSPFKGGAFGETEHGVLGGNIGRHPGGPDKGTVGSDVDDGTLLLGDHLLHGIFHTEKGPEYIDVVDTDEVVICLIRDCGVGAFIPGIIDLHIETAVVGDGLLDHILHLVLFCDVDNKSKKPVIMTTFPFKPRSMVYLLTDTDSNGLMTTNNIHRQK